MARPKPDALEIRVTPRARRDEIAGVRDGIVLVRVTAPPADGRANLAVRRLIADRLHVRLAQVLLVGGERRREKLLRIEGITAAEARGLLDERPG